MKMIVAAGYPGSLYDSRVLRNSNIFRVAENGDVLSCKDDIENTRIRLLILGDGGYPLMKWLVTPYSFSPKLTATEKKKLIKLFLQIVPHPGSAHLEH